MGGRWRELPAGGIRASQGTFSSYCLPLATKHSLEIFSELEEIKQRNDVVEKHKHP